MTISGYIITGLLVLLLGLSTYHFWDVSDIESSQAAAIDSQKTADAEQCSKNTQPAIVSDSDALQNCNTNLSTCDKLLHQSSTCVPVNIPTSCTKTANLAAARLGLTSTAIDAHNLYCRNQVEQLNNAKGWAASCLKNGTCQ